MANALKGAIGAPRAIATRLVQKHAHGLTGRHCLKGIDANIAHAVLIQRIEVARIHRTVAFHHELRSAAAEHTALRRKLPERHLHDVLEQPDAHIAPSTELAPPQVEQAAVERGEGTRVERERVPLIVEARQARDELDMGDLLLLDEGEDALWMRRHLRGEDREYVDVHAALAQQANAAHDARVRSGTVRIGTHRIVQVAISVNRDSDEEPVLAEELGPFLFDQVAVGLQRPAHPLVLTALLHPRDERMEEVKAGQGGLAALEGERNVRITRHGECTVDDGTCHVFAHDAGAPLLAMSSDIAAVPAPHVASTRCRFYQKANMLRAHGTYPPFAQASPHSSGRKPPPYPRRRIRPAQSPHES